MIPLRGIAVKTRCGQRNSPIVQITKGKTAKLDDDPDLMYNGPTVKSSDHSPSSRKPPVGVFLSATVVIFFLSLSAADSIGFVPDYLDGTEPSPQNRNELPLSDLPQLGDPTDAPPTSNVADAVFPNRIVIPAIGLDLPVQNPQTRDIDTLYEQLKDGPERYVESAPLAVAGNMIIYGHSTSLPIVRNQMYKAFNNISKLASGDIITITGDDGKSYLYSVTSVTRSDVNTGIIDISPERGTKLTLVTCDTLTGKSARFIVEADFVGSY